jgi:hypothetical protein
MHTEGRTISSWLKKMHYHPVSSIKQMYAEIRKNCKKRRMRREKKNIWRKKYLYGYIMLIIMRVTL